MNIHFPYFETLRRKIFQESLLKVQLWGPKHRTKVVDPWKIKRTDIVAFYNSFLSVFIFLFFFNFFVIKLFMVKTPLILLYLVI